MPTPREQLVTLEGQIERLRDASSDPPGGAVGDSSTGRSDVSGDGHRGRDRSTQAVLVRAHIQVSGIDDREHVSERSALLLSEGGREVTLTFDAATKVRPIREVAGPWSEVREHPTQPPGDFHPDGHVRLKGEWVLSGDRVRVIGLPTQHAFVEGTGGPRQAPAQAVSALRVCAVGIGDDREAAADAAWEAWQREQTPAPAALGWRRQCKPLAAACAALSLGLVVAEGTFGGGWLGLGITFAFVALMLWWALVPTSPFPGGASNPHDDKQHPWQFALLMCLLLLPLTAIAMVLAERAAVRNAAGSMALLIAGTPPLFFAVRGMVSKPRAVPGPQVHLPTRRRLRVALVAVMAAILVAVAGLCVPMMKTRAQHNAERADAKRP